MTPSLAQKLALVVIGFLIAILALEVVLQAAAFAMRLAGRDRPGSWLTSDVRILALGDSNTFGIWLDEKEAYPNRLAELWNAEGGEPRIEVVNLGYPSTNSSRLLANAGAILDAFAPHLVLVQVGANDFWTAPLAVEPDEAEGVFDLVKHHSLVFKLLYLAWQGFGDPMHLEVEYNRSAFRDRSQRVEGTGVLRYGDERFQLADPSAKGGTPGDRALLRENLGRIVEAAETRGIRVVLLTYPSHRSFYGVANQVTRDVAEESGITLVDLAAAFAIVCPDSACEEYFYKDQHATARGYELVARAVRDALVPILKGP